jgi:hypothetical protein
LYGDDRFGPMIGVSPGIFGFCAKTSWLAFFAASYHANSCLMASAVAVTGPAALIAGPR